MRISRKNNESNQTIDDHSSLELVFDEERRQCQSSCTHELKMRINGTSNESDQTIDDNSSLELVFDCNATRLAPMN